MEHIERVSILEHLALHSPLELKAFCERFRKVIGLPEFEYDYENETEWGLVEVNNIEYNISRPYEPGTLREWDNTIPQQCNFGISLGATGFATPSLTFYLRLNFVTAFDRPETMRTGQHASSSQATIRLLVPKL